MRLEHPALDLLLKMFTSVNPGVSIGDVAIVFDKRVITRPKYASWVVMNISSERCNTHADKLACWAIVS